MTEVEVLLDAGATIGESPTWSPKDGALYWIDIKKPALYRLHLVTGSQRCWPLTAEIGAFALDADLAGAVVALRTGIFRLDFASGLLALLAPPPFDPALHRFNEGACDATGRFWVGVMYDPLGQYSSPARKAALHSFTIEGGLRREPDCAELHNGMAWSADCRMFYLSHSEEREISIFEVSVQGHIGKRRTFATVPEALGLPDGAAIDTKGGYWCALHGGGRLRRFNGDGTVDRDIPLPVSQPTMCAFGGEALDVLYVTSAIDKLSVEQLQQEPHAGSLLCLRPGEIGIARPCTLQ